MTTGSVTVTTVVRATPDVAFLVFTDEIDAWWKRDPRHRSDPESSVVRFEGDRLVEVSASGATELGTVLVWEPGARVVLEWSGPQWALAGRTEVEVRFEPEGDGTRITLKHRGWRDLRPGDAASSVIGLWWGDLLAAYVRRPA
jgi:hypothetical protein